MGRQPVNLERDATAHGVSRYGEPLGCSAKHRFRHRWKRIELAVVRAGADRNVGQRVNLLLPGGLIAYQTRKQKKIGLSYAKSSERIGSLRSRLPVAAKIALATAGIMVGVLASPIPPGAAWLGTMCTSTTGISSMRSTS
jgi:hypothetical protein